jgi:hypothetical protein
VQAFYVIQPGDQLRFIAARFNTTWRCLRDTNPNIVDPNLIYAGDVINVGLCAGSELGSGGGDFGVPGAPDGPVCFGDRNPNRVVDGGRYTVRAGDTLDFIACDLNIATSCLVNANPNLRNIGRIDPGDTVFIPAGCPPWDGPPGPPSGFFGP